MISSSGHTAVLLGSNRARERYLRARARCS